MVDSAVLSKLALFTKTRSDGSLKHRLIWDLLRSSVNETVRLPERIVLPRIQDAVDDAHALLRWAKGSDLEWAVLDIADAFHNIPIRPIEQQFACGSYAGLFWVFMVLCMGGKASPNIWGRFAAAIGRIVSSLFTDGVLRVEIYVDDPLFVTAGPRHLRTRNLTIAMLVLALLGFP